jgi:tRNA(Leu) C34 or U34 (ribose-2'-O)-methylase TrmL
MTLRLLADGVANPANLARLDDAARLFQASRAVDVSGRLIAVENAPSATAIYGRRPLRGDATLVVGNERRGVSRRILAEADETVVIPTASQTVKTLNVAAAAAVAAWYVSRGSRPQGQVPNPEVRRPTVLIVGDDHVEIGSSLRSAAAFGFRDVLLDDRGAGWFDGSSWIRREAYVAARRYKNPLRVHRRTLDVASDFEEIVLVSPWGDGAPLQRQRLARGRGQLLIIGASSDELPESISDRVRIATMSLEPVGHVPLRLTASILLAEATRQVGRRTSGRGRPTPRRPAYESAIPLRDRDEVVVLVEPAELLSY